MIVDVTVVTVKVWVVFVDVGVGAVIVAVVTPVRTVTGAGVLLFC